MKYVETGFRAVYDNFTAFPLNETTKQYAAGLPGAEEADCILTFGYIGRDSEVALEVIACGRRENQTFRFFPADETKRIHFKVSEVQDMEFMFLDRRDGNLGKRYEAKLEQIEDGTDEMLETRRMGFLDGERELFRPDVVSVYLIKQNMKAEPVKVLITGMGENCLIGTVLEPKESFGVKKNETLAFVLQEVEEGKVICAANLNQSRKLRAEDLADGKLLKSAMNLFSKNRNEDTYVDVLEILRDSKLWVPCSVILSEADQQRMEAMVNHVLADPPAPPAFANNDAIRIAPELIQKDGKIYLPAFTAEEEMKSYGEQFTKVQKDVLEWLAIAEKNDQNISGMVINPFTDGFVLRRDVFDILKKMKSSLKEH